MQEEDLDRLAEDIRAGRDHIQVPRELVDEFEEKPTPEERQSLQAQIKEMNTGAKLKLAMHGNREARSILARDTSLMIRRYVLQNPRISDEEIVMMARNRQIDRELLDLICRNNEWLNNYQVRMAIVSNPKTPIAIALKYVGTLHMRDLRLMAKSKNIPTAVNSAAKRIVLRGGSA